MDDDVTSQRPDGRWTWYAHNLPSDFKGATAGTAHVSFATQAEAKADCMAQLRALPGPGGRLVMAKDDLQLMVDAAAQECPECACCVGGLVERHMPDAEGRNWDIVPPTSPNDCASALAERIVVLRRTYLIRDEA